MYNLTFITLFSFAVLFTGCGSENGDHNNSGSSSSSVTVPETLPKTGQTMYYQYFDDGWYQKGYTPEFSRNNDIVTDHVTGLMWQDNESTAQNRVQFDEANESCSQLTLGGYTDWRLPEIGELTMLTDYGNYNPALNPIFENNGLPDEVYLYTTLYWSTTLYIAPNGNINYGAIDSITGLVGYNSPDAFQYARCVRGDTSTTEQLTRKDEMVTDHLTGLVWQDDEDVDGYYNTDMYEWNEAIVYCHTIRLGGYDDWRLPNIKELASIIDHSQKNPALNPIFEHHYGNYYWSSTTSYYDANITHISAWYLYGGSGAIYQGLKTDEKLARCVRGL